MSSALAFIVVLFFCAAMLAVVVQDLRSLRISNRLVAGLALGWPAHAVLATGAARGMLLDLGAAVGVLLIGFFLFARGWIGAGDVKLASATALWLGPLGTLSYLLYTAVGGGLLAAAVLALRQEPLPGLVRSRRWSRRLRAPHTPLPYGVALAGGALAVMAQMPPA